MSILYDTHMHSSFSTDSDTPAQTMVRRALDLKLKGICFTDHMDLDYPPFYFPEDPSAFAADPDIILQEIRRLREQFGASDPEFHIGFGLEFGMQPHLSGCFSDIARSYPLDFIIASQHLVGGLDPYYPEVWEGHTCAELIRSYYEEMLSNLKTMDQWDTLAHLDYIIRYIPNRGSLIFDSYEAFPDLIDEILLYVISCGKCLEVNTAGYKYGLGQPNPAPSILRRYYELGGRRITIGADAHASEHIAIGFDEARKLLLSIGYERYTVFCSRVPEELPL